MSDTNPPVDSAPATDVPADEQLALFDAPTPATTSSDSAGSSDEITIGDMAAEIDTSVPADATEPDPTAEDEPEHTGICRGGPYEGRVVPCRFSGGFVLYDKQRRLMWTYATEPGRPGEFVVRSNGAPAKVTDINALRQAAEGVQLDVIAYDDGPALR
jgi:hypothetical protein